MFQLLKQTALCKVVEVFVVLGQVVTQETHHPGLGDLKFKTKQKIHKNGKSERCGRRQQRERGSNVAREKRGAQRKEDNTVQCEKSKSEVRADQSAAPTVGIRRPWSPPAEY